MKKKVLAVLLASAMVASLVGCGGGETQEAPAQTEEETTDDAEAEAEAPAETTDEAEAEAPAEEEAITATITV